MFCLVSDRNGFRGCVENCEEIHSIFYPAKFQPLALVHQICGLNMAKRKTINQAQGVIKLFMALEKAAKEMKTCCLCGSPLPTTKLANQGHLTGNHDANCPFEHLAHAAEQCIILRGDPDEKAKQAAEQNLSSRINALFVAMTEQTVPRCPFPVCDYPSHQGHRLQCPFTALKHARAHGMGLSQ